MYLNADGTKIPYGGAGWNTTYFWVDGHVGYCVQPRNRTPYSGIYQKHYWYNDAVAAALYFGYGGPGWNYAKANGWWPSRTYTGAVMSDNDYYTANHVLLSYLYSGWGDAVYGTSQSYKNWANNNLFGWVLTNLKNNAWQVPEQFKRNVYWVDTGWNTRGGVQGQDVLSYNWVDAGGLRLNKVNGITDEPISGIRFDIYNSDQWGNTYGYVTSITTDANGNAATRQNELPVGWYIMKEANPPAGCAAAVSYPTHVDSNYSYVFRQNVNGQLTGKYGWSVFENRPTVNVEFRKEWYGKSAPSTQIELYRNGVPTGNRRTLTSNGDVGWHTWGFYNLDKYDSSKRDYVYTVREVGAEGNKIELGGIKYQVSQTGNIIRNVQVKDIPIKKVWDDQDNKYGLRPDSVNVTLVRNSASGTVEVDTQTLSSENDWSHTWTDMPVASTTGEYYFYSVKEEEGTPTSKIYSSRYNAGDDSLINSLNTTNIPVSKTWVTTKPLPSSVVVKLMNGDTVVDEATVAPADGKWEHTFENVPVCDKQGNKIEYTVKDELEGYVNIFNKMTDEMTSEVTYGLTNVSTETVDIPVSKTWIENITPPTPHPSSVTVALYANGEPTGKTMQITQAGGWKGMFTGLARYNTKTGKEIAYTVREQPVDGYAWEVTGNMNSGYTVTNNFGATSVNVTKVWTGEGSNTSRRPTAVTVRLVGDGVDTGKSISISTATSWKGTFSNLPKYNEQGNEIVYTITEDAVGFYATSITGNQTDGYTVTNKYAENETSVGVAKSWNDKDDEAGLRPDSVQVVLKKQTYNGAQKLTLTANPNTVYKKQNVNIVQNKFYWGAWQTKEERYNSSYQLISSVATNTPAVNGYIGTYYKIRANSNTWDGGMLGTGDRIVGNNVGLGFVDFANAGGYNAIGLNYYETPFSTVPFYTESLPYVQRTNYTSSYLSNSGLPYLKFPDANNYVFPQALYVTNGTGYVIYGMPMVHTIDTYGGEWIREASFYNQSTSTSYPSSLRVVTSIADTSWKTGGTSYTYGRNNNTGSIYLNVPVGGSSFYPTATANARHALGFYYTAAADTTVNIKMQTQTGYWNEGYTFATFTAKKGTHYYTITQNATNALSGKVRLDFLDGSANNLNGNVADLSMWNTASGTTTADAGKIATLSASNNWSASFEGLPRFDTATNAPIEYVIEEQPVDGYTPSIRNTSVSYPSYTQNEQKMNPYYSYNVTNTLGELRDIPVSKVWSDTDDLLKKRPESVTVELYRNGTATGETKVLSEDNNWSSTFTNLRAKDNSGALYTYTVRENRCTGYAEPVITGNQDTGFTVSNTLPITTVSVNKQWNDLDNAFSTRAGSVTVHLLADGEDTGKQTMLSGENSWSFTFENLPVLADDGHEIAYTVTEDAVEGYQTSITGTPVNYTITNTMSKMSITASKVWDAEQRDIPESVDIALYQNGSEVARKTVSEATNWKCTFEDLDVYDASGNEYAYTVDEVTAVDGFEKSISGDVRTGFTIKNTEILDIPIYKQWDDYNDIDELRPDSVTVNLYSTDSSVSAGDGTSQKALVETVQLSEANDWAHVFTNLPKYNAAGNKLAYTVEELPVDTYTTDIAGSALNGFTVTNSHQIYYKSVTVDKVWDDLGDVDKIRPEGINVRLLQDGSECKTHVLNDANGWSWTFDKLPIRDDATGTEHKYTVEEDVPEGYEATYSQSVTLDWTITNKHVPTKRDVTVEKMWSVPEGSESEIPSSITVNLLRDGEAVDTVEMTPDASGKWAHTFETLPKTASDGHEYEYTVQEEAIENFLPLYAGDQDDGFVIINNYTLTNLSIDGVKTWSGDTPDRRPDHITVHLLANGNVIDTQDVRPNEAGTWEFSFGEHPMFDKETGEEIVYTLQEDDIKGYYVEYGFTDDGKFKINNRASKTISVKKEWVDDDNANGSRPKDVEVDLLGTRFTNSGALHWSDGKSLGTDGLEHVDANAIGYAFSLDPASDFVGEIKCNGMVRDAVVKVLDAERNVLSSTTVNVNGGTEPVAFEIGNIPFGAFLLVTDADGNDIHETVTSLLIHDSQTSTNVVTSMKLSASNKWAGEFDELMERDNKGFPLSYEVKEKPCYGYKSELSGTEASGYIIRNTEIDEIKLYKEWMGTNSETNAVTLPTSVNMVLLQNGTPTDKKITLTADNGWTGAFSDIAWRDATGKEIEYSVEEEPVANWMAARIDNNIREDYSVNVANVPSFKVKFSKSWVGDEAHLDGRPNSVEVSLLRSVKDTTHVKGDFAQWGSDMSASLNQFSDMYAMPSNAGYSFSNSSDETAYVKLTFKQDGREVLSHVVALPAKESTTGTVNISKLDSTQNTTVTVSDVNAADRTSATLAENGKIEGELMLADETEVENANVTEADEWQYEGNEFALMDTRGNAFDYKAVETSNVPNYSSSITGTPQEGYKITNTFGKIDIPVQKVWNDVDDKDGIRPNEIEVALLANGTETGDTLVLNAGNEWRGTFSMMDVEDADGNAIEYTVKETSEVEGYTSAIAGDMENGYVVTNSHDPKTNVTVSKVWDDNSNLKKMRPSKLTVHLMRDGKEIAVADMTGNNDTWAYTFQDLPALDDDGNEIEYTVIEDSVSGYTQTSVQKTDSGYVLVNWTEAPIVELPFTGGPGFWIVAGLGVALAVFVTGTAFRRNLKRGKSDG